MKKPFFKERTEAEIKKLKKIEVANIAEFSEAIENAKADEFIQIKNPVIPRRYGAVSFNKYGSITKTHNFRRVEECLCSGMHPYMLLRDAVNSMDSPTLGFSIVPPQTYQGEVLRTDLRPLIVPWKEVFEGHRLFAYSLQQNVPIDIKRISGEDIAHRGRTVEATIPSRTDKADRYNTQLKHVPGIPVKATTPYEIAAFQFYIPLTIRPEETSLKRRYLALRENMPGLSKEEVFPVVWLDIALYIEMMRRDVTETREYLGRHPKEKNFHAPTLEFTPFPLLTKEAVNHYRFLCNNALNNLGGKLRDAEKNLAIGERARARGYDSNFFARKSQGGKIGSYDWSIPG